MTDTNSTQNKNVILSEAKDLRQNTPAPVPHVVIVGGGFGGLEAANKLGKQPVQVTLIDRNNYHLFQPMLYQVATSGLAPADIAAPIRDTLHKYKKNTTVLMAEVTGVDPQQQLVFLQDRPPLHYDYLILATGATSNMRYARARARIRAATQGLKRRQAWADFNGGLCISLPTLVPSGARGGQ